MVLFKAASVEGFRYVDGTIRRERWLSSNGSAGGCFDRRVPLKTALIEGFLCLSFAAAVVGWFRSKCRHCC